MTISKSEDNKPNIGVPSLWRFWSIQCDRAYPSAQIFRSIATDGAIDDDDRWIQNEMSTRLFSCSHLHGAQPARARERRSIAASPWSCTMSDCWMRGHPRSLRFGRGYEPRKACGDAREAIEDGGSNAEEWHAV